MKTFVVQNHRLRRIFLQSRCTCFHCRKKLTLVPRDRFKRKSLRHAFRYFNQLSMNISVVNLKSSILNHPLLNLYIIITTNFRTKTMLCITNFGIRPQRKKNDVAIMRNRNGSLFHVSKRKIINKARRFRLRKDFHILFEVKN